MAVSVSVECLSKRYSGAVAVDNVSFRVDPGELFFLLGPSGCGKTTLLRSIAGFCEPDSGAIRLDERDITRLPPHERDTGMVFQSYALWPHMTVRQNVAFGLEMRRKPREEIRRRVDAALDMVRMSERGDSRPNQLSGGQQQRVAVARALVVQPKCLLLDEPLSNLDAKLRLDMRTEIRRICKESGLTAIYVTHDQKEALSMADRVAVMDKGRIRQVGTPRDIYVRPRDPFVAGFIGEANFLSGTVAEQRNGRLVVETAVGLVAGSAGEGAAVRQGERVTVCFRPESVRLVAPETAKAADAAPAGRAAANRFRGQVCGSLYLGEMAQHQIACLTAGGGQRAGVTVKAVELSPKSPARDTEQEICVCVEPEDVAVLAE
jgi:iron(III) transport system ATP-binding protein